VVTSGILLLSLKKIQNLYKKYIYKFV
jgi:hypothetical protein